MKVEIGHIYNWDKRNWVVTGQTIIKLSTLEVPAWTMYDIESPDSIRKVSKVLFGALPRRLAEMLKNVKVGKIYTRTYEQDDGQGFYDIVTQYVMIIKKDKHFEESDGEDIYCLYDIQDHDNIWWEYEDILKEELNEVGHNNS